MAKFRFEDLEIWQEAVSLARELFLIANELEQKKLWRFADQLRGAAIGIPNNISESTASDRLREQQQLLRYAKRECYESANMIMIFHLENHVTKEKRFMLFNRLDVLSRRIDSYSDSLEKKFN